MKTTLLVVTHNTCGNKRLKTFLMPTIQSYHLSRAGSSPASMSDPAVVVHRSKAICAWLWCVLPLFDS